MLVSAALKAAEQKLTYIDGFAFDKIISEFYGKDYHILRVGNIIDHNDEYVTIWGDDGYTAEEQVEAFQKWNDEDDSPHPSIIMNDLIAKGVVPSGAEYTIYCWW